MGDASPDNADLVCPSCDAEFRRPDEPRGESVVDCPDCGRPVSVSDGAPGASGEGAGEEDEFGGDPPATARVEMPGAVGETDPIEEEDTAQDQRPIGEARRSSGELEGSGPAEDGPESEAADLDLDPGGGALGRDFGGSPESSDDSATEGAFGEGSTDGVAPKSGDEEEVDKTPHLGGEGIAERMSGGSLSEEREAAGDEPGGEGEGEAEEIEKTPHMGVEQVAEEWSDAGDQATSPVAADGERDGAAPPEAPQSPPEVEDDSGRTEKEDEDTSRERGVAADTTPTAGLDKALEDTAPPEIGEDTEAAIDRALEDEFGDTGGDGDRGSGGGGERERTASSPSSAQELVVSLREESGIEGNPDTPYDVSLDDSGERSTDGSETGRRSGSPGGPPPVPGGTGGGRGESSEEVGGSDPADGGARPSPAVGRGAPGQEDGSETSAESGFAAGRSETEPPEEESSFVSGTPDSGTAAPEGELSGAGAPESRVESESREQSSGGGGATVLILAGIGGLIGLFAYFDPVGVLSDDPGRGGAETSRSEPSEGPVREAVAAAQRTVGEAVRVDTADSDRQRAVASRLEEAGRHRAAARVYGVLWRKEREDAEVAGVYVENLVAAGRYTEARRVAMEASQATGDEETFRKKFASSVERDPRLQSYEAVDVAELDGVETIESSGDRETDGFVLTGGDGSAEYLFSPATEPDNEWRDDVAAWRLCELIVCSFEIPHTRPAKITRSDFREMFEGEGGSAARAAAEFDWQEAGGQGAGEVVRGSLRRWRSGVVRWPIELVDVWRPWLSTSGDPSKLEEPLEEAIASFEDLGDGSSYRQVLEASDGAPTRTIARQLSDIIVFDYLTNNWDRFAEEESAYGSFNHFAGGRFVTLRTPTVFQRRKSTRVKGRFGWISRFGRDTMTALRMLGKETARGVMYPDPTGYDRAKLDIFWQQRGAVLDRVDELVEEEGRDEVLFFE